MLNENDDAGDNNRAENTWEDDTDELEQIMKKNISKNLVCSQCKRKFNHRNSLLYHLRSHSGKRPHACKLCPKSFFSSSALKVFLILVLKWNSWLHLFIIIVGT